MDSRFRGNGGLWDKPRSGWKPSGGNNGRDLRTPDGSFLPPVKAFEDRLQQESREEVASKMSKLSSSPSSLPLSWLLPLWLPGDLLPPLQDVLCSVTYMNPFS